MRPNVHRPTLLLSALAFLLLLTQLAAAQTTREVNQNDPGAIYQTINAAVADALPGDTILVHPGTYEEAVTISGITLSSLRGPEVTVIQSPDGTGDGVTLTGNQNVTLNGFRIQGFVDGVMINTNAGSTRVSNCVVAGNSDDGFHFAASMPTSAKIVNNISADNGGNGFNAVRNVDVSFTSMFSNISYRNGMYGFLQTGDSITRDCIFGDYNCVYGNGTAFGWDDSAGAHTISTDPLIDERMHYRFTSESSPAVNAGHPSNFYNDPDGSPNDMGPYGGPQAVNWWRDPFGGPTVENVTVDPPQVRPGGTITIRATARTE